MESLFDLGNVPSVNSFPTTEQIPHERPALLEMCVCPHCTLVQLSTTIAKEDLFTEYRYLSSASQTQIRYLGDLAAMLAKRFTLHEHSRILEVGSNDGTLLAAFLPWTKHILGIDPAKNLVPEASSRGVPMVADFLTEETAEQITKEHGHFDIILGLNVYAHNPDIGALLRATHTLLSPDGTFILEAVNASKTILRGSYDTVYHEHVFCYSLTALHTLYARAGLTVVDVEETPMQGGSLRVYAQRTDHHPTIAPAVAQMLDDERADGITNLGTYQRVGESVRQHIHALREGVEELQRRHGRVWALGASARGVVILNAGKLDTTVIECIVDDTPLKQGRHVPGVHIPVVGWETLRALPKKPTAFLLTAWNYEREVLEKLQRLGDVHEAEIIVPFPALRTVALQRVVAEETYPIPLPTQNAREVR
ncbi:MAG: C-methyltransferase [Parcubacteria group bacterium Gr01-1014_106]|nr:MAG: C-methyltransferase [Parcubacteria group bacterium Gr01-1014_106]